MKIRNYQGRNFKKLRSDDKLSKDGRAKLMSTIRSKNTKFETDFLSALTQATKQKFHTHLRGLRGTPDIVFIRRKVCVFLDSDFWHGWQYPRWKHLLKNDFWREKIEKNRARDRRNTAFLRKQGWKVLRFWEHQIKTNNKSALVKILEALEK